MLCLEADHSVEVPLDSGERVEPGQQFSLAPEYVIAGRLHDGTQEVVAVCEVEVQLALGGMCALAHIVECRAGYSARCDQLGRCLDDSCSRCAASNGSRFLFHVLKVSHLLDPIVQVRGNVTRNLDLLVHIPKGGQMSFEHKNVLVTGSTSGIGRAAAEQFGEQGAHVIVTGRDAGRGQQVVDTIESSGGRARFVSADLSTPDGAEQLARAAGQIDILVNNAGIFPFGATHEIAIEDVTEALSFNIVAPFVLTAALVPGMIERGDGRIVNVSTMVASFGLPGMSAYGASKAAIELLTKAWAAEYGPAGVRVNAVAPGPTRTPGTAPMGEGLDQIATTLPLGRVADPREIANTIVYLASDDASYVNGAIVAVDGGRVAV